jgi:hypothetical protein
MSSSNFFSDMGLIFFVSWTFVLTRLSIAAFGTDLLPWSARNSPDRGPSPRGYSARP